ncbi:hypothetical protein GCG21_03340 [Pseudactinotalea sp. HY160]|nr:hypothetical protein [Pseudactinotalea sp. HY160]
MGNDLPTPAPARGRGPSGHRRRGGAVVAGPRRGRADPGPRRGHRRRRVELGGHRSGDHPGAVVARRGGRRVPRGAVGAAHHVPAGRLARPQRR